MNIDWSEYSDSHCHPDCSRVVEIVAYERRDGSWDVFIYERESLSPELELRRIDEVHVFFRRITSRDDLEQVANEIDKYLGDGYTPSLYYREPGGRMTISRIYDHLVRHGVHSGSVRESPNGDWELWIREKDWPIASGAVSSNVLPSAGPTP